MGQCLVKEIVFVPKVRIGGHRLSRWVYALILEVGAEPVGKSSALVSVRWQVVDKASYIVVFPHQTQEFLQATDALDIKSPITLYDLGNKSLVCGSV